MCPLCEGAITHTILRGTADGSGFCVRHGDVRCVFIGDRLGPLYSLKDYSSEWGMHPDTKRLSYSIDPTRFGVNMIVYALTR